MAIGGFRASVDCGDDPCSLCPVLLVLRKCLFKNCFFVLHPLQLDQHVAHKDENRIARDELQEDTKRSDGFEKIEGMTHESVRASCDKTSGFGHQTEGPSQVGECENREGRANYTYERGNKDPGRRKVRSGEERHKIKTKRAKDCGQTGHDATGFSYGFDPDQEQDRHQREEAGG